MLAAERRDNLLARLAADGKLVAKDVARDLGLSDDTVRRDLRDLAAAGLCGGTGQQASGRGARRGPDPPRWHRDPGRWDDDPGRGAGAARRPRVHGHHP